MVTRDDVRRAARDVGAARMPVCVHASLRSFGGIEGGPATVIGGLLDEGCTVMVPTFTAIYMAQGTRRIERNAWDGERPPEPWWVTDRAYTSSTTECEEGLGALPAFVAAMPGRARGAHPLMSFCAVGPLAEALVATQTSEDPLAPLAMVAARGGAVVLMGVAPDRMTLIHVAEQRAGRTLFRRWTVNPGGPPVEVAYGGCSNGFGKLWPAIGHLARETRAGESRWVAFPAAETIDAAAAAIRADPMITHCGASGCRCDEAVAGGPIV